LKVQKNSHLTKAGWLLFYLYIILLFYFLFFSEHYGREHVFREYRYNLVLFKEIKRFITYRKQLGIESFVVNILGNILAFTPFGFMLPMLNMKYRRFFYVTFLSILFSFSIELIQLIFKVGIFDVDDMLMNTVGGILGYIAYKIFSVFLKKLHSGKNTKKPTRKKGRT